MTNTAPSYTGSCMCGAVRYEATGAPDRVLHCHCQSCREHTGAPVATLAVFTPDQVAFSGDARKRYASAPGVERAFCGTCGSSLTWETTLGAEPICAIHISNFENPEKLPPDGHSFYGERIGWFDVHDVLPRHDSFVGDSAPSQHGPTRTE